MISTYQAGDNTSTGGTAIGKAGTAVEIFKILIGTPVDGDIVYLFDITNPGGTTNTNLAFKLTQATHAAGEEWVREVDFTNGHGEGLVLGNGANLMINGTMDVTVLWDYAQSEGGTE